MTTRYWCYLQWTENLDQSRGISVTSQSQIKFDFGVEMNVTDDLEQWTTRKWTVVIESGVRKLLIALGSGNSLGEGSKYFFSNCGDVEWSDSTWGQLPPIQFDLSDLY